MRDSIEDAATTIENEKDLKRAIELAVEYESAAWRMLNHIGKMEREMEGKE